MTNQKTVDDVWEARVTSDGKLIGPYPIKMDLCGERFPNLSMHQEPKLVIEGDGDVRQIRMPCDVIGVDYLVIRDLPVLDELILEEGKKSKMGVQWLELSGIPSLSTVSIRGPIRSLKISGAKVLASLDLSGCPDLDFVAVDGACPDVEINVRGCLKLRGIQGLSVEIVNASRLCEQINENQRRSRLDCQIYESMTYTDIDLVYEVINEGVKALSRSDALREFHESLLGCYDLHACDPQFRPYLYRILEPLEPVYTGGTGEIYAYEVSELTFCAESLEVTEEYGQGISSLERCLSQMLHLTRMSMMSWHRESKNMSGKKILKLLKDASEAVPKDMIPGLPIMISELIDADQREEIAGLIRSMGMRLGSGQEASYVYIHPVSRVPKKEQKISDKAVLSINATDALDQLGRYRLWRARSSEGSTS